MITKRQGFIAYGVPAGQGRMTCIGRPGFHNLQPSNKKHLHEWRRQVRLSAEEWFTETADEYQPLSLRALFFVARPKNHYRTGAFSEQLRDDAPRYPSKRVGGDLDHLVRAVGDALQQSGHIHDDAQFVEFTKTRKLYVAQYPGQPGTLARPGVIVEVWPL